MKKRRNTNLPVRENLSVIFWLVLLSLLLVILFNEWTLGFWLNTEYRQLVVSDLWIIRIVDLAIIGICFVFFILRKNPSGITNTLLVMGSFLIAVIIIELVLKTTDLIPVTGDIYTTSPSEKYSHRLKKNYNKTMTMGNSHVDLRINNQGMHWRDIPQKLDVNQETIAFVGDSFTFGLWATDWKNGFVGIFEQTIKEDSYRTLNFGVPGYGFEDILLQIKQEVNQYKPNYIILVSYMGNDLLDTYLGLQRYKVSESGLLEFQPEVLEHKIPKEYRLKRTSSLTSILFKLDTIKLIKKILSGYINEKVRDNNNIHSFERKDYGSNIFWSQVKYPDFANEALDVSLDTLQNIHEFCIENDITLLLVALPSQEQVYYPEKFKDGYDINLPQQYFESFANSRKIPYLDLLPELHIWFKNNQNEDLHFRFDGHFNNKGHAVSGHLIANFFERYTKDSLRN